MKIYFIIILLLLGFGSLAQNCPEYGKLIKDGDNDTKLKQFKKALNNFNAAKLCSPSMASEVDKKINLLFDAIEKEKDEALTQKKEADMSKKVAEENLRKLSELISNITELIQSDKTDGIIGFLPFKRELLNFLIPANQFISSNSKINKLNIESPIAHYQLGVTYENIGKSFEAEKEYNISFDELKSILNESIKNKIEVSEKTITTFLEVGMLISWTNIDRYKFNEAKDIINYTEGLLSKLIIKKTAKFYSSLAGFENLKNNYIGKIGNKKQAFIHINRAIEFIELAESLDSNNVYFKISKATYLRNSIIDMPDSIINKTDKEKNTKKSCEIYNTIVETAGNGTKGIGGWCNCVIDASYNTENDTTKINYLKKVANRLTTLVHLDPQDLELKLNLAWINVRIAQIQQNDLKDEISAAVSIDNSANDWVNYVKNNTTTYQLWKIKNIYGDLIELIKHNIYFLDKYVLFEKMNFAFETNEKLYGDIKSVSEIVINNYINMGSEKILKKTKKDSLISKNYFLKASNFLGKLQAIDTTKYSENNELCSIYDQLITLSIYEDDYQSAMKNYQKMHEVFGPFYRKYDFDFYLGQHFWGSAMRLGKYLYYKKLYIEAIPMLKYASYFGMKESTSLLAEAFKYGYGVKSNVATSDSLMKLAEKLSGTMNKFTIQCDYGSKIAPFDVYVMELPKEYPYKGIDDQAEWLKQARGGIIPKDVRESFIKLQKIAWENDVSYPDLCYTTFVTANEDKVIDKYEPLKKEISDEKDRDKKRFLYRKLFEDFENDISKETDTKNIDLIKKDALKVYEAYTVFLGNDDKIEKNRVFSRILELDPENKNAKENLVKLDFEHNMGNPEILCKTKDLGRLKTYLKLYLEQQNKKSADIVLNKILTIEDNIETRYEMNQLYYLFGLSKFESLFLSDTKNTQAYRSFFINKRKKISSSYNKQMLYYMELVKLDEAYLKINSDSITKKEVSQHYNSLSWNCLLSKDYNILKYLERSIELDASSPYPKGNLPHFYLFNNKVGKAKELYLKFKDLPFDEKGGYPTFKDAFLSDFKDFEKEGITHEKLNEIKELLIK